MQVTSMLTYPTKKLLFLALNNYGLALVDITTLSLVQLVSLVEPN